MPSKLRSGGRIYRKYIAKYKAAAPAIARCAGSYEYFISIALLYIRYRVPLRHSAVIPGPGVRAGQFLERNCSQRLRHAYNIVATLRFARQANAAAKCKSQERRLFRDVFAATTTRRGEIVRSPTTTRDGEGRRRGRGY